jgi:hypothetical protein
MAVVILILTNSCRMHSVFVISSHLFIAFKIFNAMVALHHFFRSLHNHCKKYSIETARLNHIKLRKISLNFKAPIVQFRVSIYLYVVIVCYYKTNTCLTRSTWLKVTVDSQIKVLLVGTEEYSNSSSFSSSSLQSNIDRKDP